MPDKDKVIPQLVEETDDFEELPGQDGGYVSQVGNSLGKYLPSDKRDFVMAQLRHETGDEDLSSHVSRENNNFSGITFDPKYFPAEWKGTARPAKEGGHYVHFPTVDDWAQSHVNTYLKKDKGAGAPIDASDLEDYVHRLKKNGYFTAPEKDYMHGISAWYNKNKTPQLIEETEDFKELPESTPQKKSPVESATGSESASSASQSGSVPLNGNTTSNPAQATPESNGEPINPYTQLPESYTQKTRVEGPTGKMVPIDTETPADPTNQAVNTLAEHIVSNAVAPEYKQNLKDVPFNVPGSVVHDITDTHGNPEMTGQYTDHAVANLKLEKQHAMRQLAESGGANDPDYASNVKAINDDFDQKIAKIVDAGTHITSLQLANKEYTSKKYTPEEGQRKIDELHSEYKKEVAEATGGGDVNIARGKYEKEKAQVKQDTKYDAVQLGLEQQKLLGNKQAEADLVRYNNGQPLEDVRGVTGDERRVGYQAGGLKIMQTAATAAAQGGNENVAKEMAANSDNIQQRLEEDNPKYFRKAWGEQLGSYLYKNEHNPLFGTLFARGELSKEDIRKYGKEAGLSQDQIDKLQPEDVPTMASWPGIFAQKAFNTLLMQSDKNPMGEMFTGNMPKEQKQINNWRGITGEMAGGAGVVGAFMAQSFLTGGALKEFQLLGNVAKNAQRYEKAADLIPLAVSNYNNAYENSKEIIGDKPKDELKRQAYSLLNATISTAIMSISPAALIGRDAIGMTSAGKSFISKLKAAGIESFTKDEFKSSVQQILEQIAKTAKGTAEHTLTQAAIMGTNKGAENITDMFFDPTHKHGVMDNVGETAIQAGISMFAPSLFAGMRGARGETPANKSLLWDIATNPREYRDQVQSQYKEGKLTKDEAIQTINNIDKASSIVSTQIPTESVVNGKELTIQEKQDYAWNVLKGDYLKEKLNTLPEKDVVQRKLVNQQIKEIEQRREDILKNAGETTEVEKPLAPQTEPGTSNKPQNAKRPAKAVVQAEADQAENVKEEGGKQKNIFENNPITIEDVKNLEPSRTEYGRKMLDEDSEYAQEEIEKNTKRGNVLNDYKNGVITAKEALNDEAFNYTGDFLDNASEERLKKEADELVGRWDYKFKELEALKPNEPKAQPTVSIDNFDDLINNGSARLEISANGEKVPFKTFDVAIDNDAKTAEVVFVEKADPTKNKGIGYDSYVELGNKLAEKGITLESKGQAQYEPGKRIWDRLVKEGYAKGGNGRYEFIAKEGRNQERSVAPEADKEVVADNQSEKQPETKVEAPTEKKKRKKPVFVEESESENNNISLESLNTGLNEENVTSKTNDHGNENGQETAESRKGQEADGKINDNREKRDEAGESRPIEQAPVENETKGENLKEGSPLVVPENEVKTEQNASIQSEEQQQKGNKQSSEPEHARIEQTGSEAKTAEAENSNSDKRSKEEKEVEVPQSLKEEIEAEPEERIAESDTHRAEHEEKIIRKRGEIDVQKQKVKDAQKKINAALKSGDVEGHNAALAEKKKAEGLIAKKERDLKVMESERRIKGHYNKLADAIENQYSKNKEAHRGIMAMNLPKGIGDHIADYLIEKTVSGLRKIGNLHAAIYRAIEQAKVKFGDEAKELGPQHIFAIKKGLDNIGISAKPLDKEPELSSDNQKGAQQYVDEILADDGITYDFAVDEIMNSEGISDATKSSILNYIDWHLQDNKIPVNAKTHLSEFQLTDSGLTEYLGQKTTKEIFGEEGLADSEGEKKVRLRLADIKQDAANITKDYQAEGGPISQWGAKMFNDIKALQRDGRKQGAALAGLHIELQAERVENEAAIKKLDAEIAKASDPELIKQRVDLLKEQQKIKTLIASTQNFAKKLRSTASDVLNTGRLDRMMRDDMMSEYYQDRILSDRQKREQREMENALNQSIVEDYKNHPEYKKDKAAEEAKRSKARKEKEKTEEKQKKEAPEKKEKISKETKEAAARDKKTVEDDIPRKENGEKMTISEWIDHIKKKKNPC